MRIAPPALRVCTAPADGCGFGPRRRTLTTSENCACGSPMRPAAGEHLEPLVVEIGAKTWAWVESGRLWISSGAAWAEASSDAPIYGFGGRVLTRREVEALEVKLGRPAA